MKNYDHHQIELKWQARWEEDNLYATPKESSKKHYALFMFPYPSGSGLHVGHALSLSAMDIYSRFTRMNGANVLFPIGWDSFGLPAETYAMKHGAHPKGHIEETINGFKKQVKRMGLSVDWATEIATHTQQYYRWTQWIFLQLFKQGLAYKKNASVNWCPNCKTVLANEQVIQGRCERCDSLVEKKELSQWFLKTTQYADSLLEGLDDLQWPESTKHQQKHWIGKKKGHTVTFKVHGHNVSLDCFTTRIETIMGVTAIVIAPEHPLADTLINASNNKSEARAYQDKVAQKSDLERQQDTTKTGVVLDGVFCNHPIENRLVPIVIADYVLASFGTGAVMAVPAHDERDQELAQLLDLETIQVILDDSLVNSGEWNNMSIDQARSQIAAKLELQEETSYRLRDWLISRQRYWGTPIPVVYDPQGQAHPISEEHLPWTLPQDVDFSDTDGQSPLDTSQEFKDRVTKLYGEGWTPEIDTMDTFMCSSWYFLRYTDPTNDTSFASSDSLKRWMPVDMYMGGAEHATSHLLFARFIMHALHDMGHVPFKEPFKQLIHQGMILGEGGHKMSKSKGNGINPDEVIDQYGADTLRLYEMFMGPIEDTKPWDTDSIQGVRKFLERIFRVQEFITDSSDEMSVITEGTIQEVTQEYQKMSYNTAISKLMEWTNAVFKTSSVTTSQYVKILQLLAPMAPHTTEELWEQLGQDGSIHTQSWPTYDSSMLESADVQLAVSINGKKRAVITASKDANQQDIEEIAQQQESVQRHLEGVTIIKVIYKPGRILNYVVK